MTMSKVCAAVTISRSGSFELELPPAKALLLFTAPGEKLWIEEWDPIILHGDGFESGTIFVTTNHGPNTYWTVSEFDTQARHAKYIRVTPESDTGTVDVNVTSNRTGGSTINITYQLTGLTPAGNEKLNASYSESDYAAMMQEWKRMIQNSGAVIDEHFRDSGR